MSHLKVGVVAICYNHDRFVVETLNSIVNQSYPIYELIIIDSNSKDQSQAVIEHWIANHETENIQFIKQTQNRTICENLNQALSLLKCEIFQFISCDDVMHIDKVKEQISVFETQPNTGVVFTDAEFIDVDSKELGKRYIPGEMKAHYALGNASIKHSLGIKNSVPAASIMGRMDIFKDIGIYDTNIIYEDWDFLLRVAESNWEMQFLDIVSVKYRLLDTSHWKEKTYRMIKSTFYLFKKHNLLNKTSGILDFYSYYDDISQIDKLKYAINLMCMGNMKHAIIYIRKAFMNAQEESLKNQYHRFFNVH